MGYYNIINCNISFKYTFRNVSYIPNSSVERAPNGTGIQGWSYCVRQGLVAKIKYEGGGGGLYIVVYEGLGTYSYFKTGILI